MDMLTIGQINTWAERFEKIAQEMLEVEQIGSSLFAFGSQPGCQRLKEYLGDSEDFRSGYSQNLQRWYVVMDQLPQVQKIGSITTQKQQPSLSTYTQLCPVLTSVKAMLQKTE